MFSFVLGYYVYVEAGSGSFFSTATLKSPNMTKTAAGCALQFWYHMYGNSFSDMNVRLYYKGGKSVIFEASGDKGNKWNKVMVGLGAMDKGIKYILTSDLNKYSYVRLSVRFSVCLS